MLATSRPKQEHPQTRRGIVLVLILGMLGLLALIGITFATFTGQSRIGARNYAQSTLAPVATDLMDFALAQLIGDTDDLRSAIRGHSMARDMYGNDAAFNGMLMEPLSGPNPHFWFNQATVCTSTTVTGHPEYAGLIQCVTNIALGDVAYYGYDFTRWIVKFPHPLHVPYVGLGGTPPTALYQVKQTYEVIIDDNATGVTLAGTTYRTFYLPPPAVPPAAGPPVVNHGYVGPRQQAPTSAGHYVSPEVDTTGTVANTITTESELFGEYLAGLTPNPIPVNASFTLDGRYLRAFNGTGMAGNAAFANFRYNGWLLGGAQAIDPAPAKDHPGDPNVMGMDEGYDACDLDNWFLAMQSADGKVVVPSFHRPGIVARTDWTTKYNPTDTQAQQVTEIQAMSRILRPRAVDGHNAASFPNLIPDSNTGLINYDVDNDGDGTPDSVWVDLGYPARQDSRGLYYKPMFAFMVIGLNGRLPLNTAGNLALRGEAPGTGRLYMHASHLGNSPSEVDPTFALQNYFDPLNPLTGLGATNTQVDNAGKATQSGAATFDPTTGKWVITTVGDNPISVNVTQLRNILTGTRPPIDRFQPVPPPPSALSGDANWVLVNGQFWYLPNNVPDLGDVPAAGTIVNRPATTVAGRWGEEGFIPSFWDTSVTPLMSFNNLIRAGMSVLNPLPGVVIDDTFDARDDNFNAYDFWPSPAPNAAATPPLKGGELEGPSSQALNGGATPVTWPADYYDAAGDLALPVERSRRAVTPSDSVGDGRIVNFSNLTDTGADAFGRVGYQFYFRPAGVPPATATGSHQPSGVLPPAASFPLAVGTPSFPDITNNPFHGYDARRNPNLPGGIPGFSQLHYAAAPADYDSSKTPPDVALNSGGVSIPTFNGKVNSLDRNPNLNEASEMKLYQPTNVDAPFGNGDLEWLYRDHDRDGTTLHSRLADLAPISFTNPSDGLRRRRMFSVDASESTGIPWGTDNPGNLFPDNSVTPWPTATQVYNAQLNGLPLLTTSGGLGSIANQISAYVLNPNLYNTTPNQASIPVSPYMINLLKQAAPNYSYSYSEGVSLAHRDRKINLNYPLPVSNDPDEPTRNKWITEAYTLLKKALPPLSLDTPEELAQLSQYLINVIDFRDPDATMTHWQNPDLVLVPGTATVAPYLATAGTPGGLAFNQYGMEYNPVALNEVLAFTYQYNPASPSNRFFVELVNTLTAPNPTSSGTLNPSALDLAGFNYTFGATPSDPYAGGCWDLVFTADDPASRPDPFRGDLVLDSTGTTAKWYGLLPLTRETFGQSTAPYDVTLTPLNPGSAKLTTFATDVATSIPAPTPAGVSPLPSNYFYVIGNNPASAAFEQGTPSPTNYWPLTTNGLSAVTANTPDFPNTATNKAASMIQAVTGTYDPMNATTPPTIHVHAGILPGATEGGTLPGNYHQQIPPPALQTVSYYWVCLRRPANPFAPVSANNPMIVVDAMRFPYIEGTGKLVNKASGVPNDVPAMVPDTNQANTIYSVQRFQPNRGGHAAPYFPPAASAVPPPPTPAPSLDARYGYTDQIAPPGKGPTVTVGGATNAYSAAFGTRGIFYKDSAGNYYYATGGLPICTGGNGSAQVTTAGAYHTLGWANETTENWNHPVFHDRDFTSVAELTLVPGCPPGLFTKQFAESSASTFVNTMTQTTGVTAFKPYPTAPLATGASAAASAVLGNNPTFPYLSDKFFYTSASESVNAPGSATWDKVYGPSSGGWFKMFEFFEVPSPVYGAVGQVAQGVNYDWFRQDTKPGLLNLNLIIDEEVFLGLMGNAGARTDLPGPLQQVLKTPTNLNATAVPIADLTGTAGPTKTPQIVTEWDYTTGAPHKLTATQWAAYPMPDTGFFDSTNGNNFLKAAFSDFLKLRYGGTGYLFGAGAYSPFRSLTFPDVNSTLMRPAYHEAIGRISGSDAGVKNYKIFNHAPAAGTPVYPPPIPPRRLLQIPDNDATTTASTNPTTAILTAFLGYDPANATNYPNLSIPAVDLTSGSIASPTTWLQGNKESPYFRSEWLQKMMNLTTVRTHQYAVWITVGFFEVRQQGDPSLAFSNPTSAYDVLGPEIGLMNGRNRRYRGFFIVDRLKLTGFDPNAPGKYRDAVLYRTLIE